jgi:putative transcriptional regulator
MLIYKYKGGEKQMRKTTTKLKSNIKFLRKSKEFDLTQKELADKLGLTTVAIYKIENGRGINIRTARQIAKFFNVKIDDLFDWQD